MSAYRWPQNVGRGLTMRNRVILIACVLAGFLWAPYVTAQERGVQEERAAYIVASNCVTVVGQNPTVAQKRKIDATKVHIYGLMNGEGGWVLIDAQLRAVRDVIYYNLNSGETVCGFRNWKELGRKFHKEPGNVDFFASTGSAVGTSTVGGSTRYRDYDDKMLCPLALAGGGTRWETRQTWLPAVEEAQRRGFSVEDCRNIAASKGPSTERRPIAVEWDGYRSLFAGYIELSDTGREGRISVTLPDNEGTCSGTYRYDDDRHGTWSITCTNGLAAAGEVQRYGKGQGSSGEGVDARGNKVRFTVGAAVGRTYRPAQTLMRISRRSASATEAYAAAGADLRDGAAVGPLTTNFGHW